jgi:hypothetical protein
MQLLRTIVAVLVALSLAALPLGATATAFPFAKAGAVDMHAHAEVNARAAMDRGSHTVTDQPCHHQDGKSGPASKLDTECQFAPCCVGASVAVAPSVSAEFKTLVFKEGRFPGRTDRFVADDAGPPPFRPPRV